LRNTLKLANPLSEEESIMRTTMLPSLLNVVAYNQSRQIPDLALFEVRKIFIKENEQINEKNVLAAITVGSLAKDEVNAKNYLPDFNWMKGVVENLFQVIKVEEIKLSVREHLYFGNNESAEIIWQGKPVGSIGKIDKNILNNFNVHGEVYYFEIELDQIIQALPLKVNKFESLPKYPSVSRDIAMFTPETVSSAQIEEVIKKTGEKLIESIHLFDYYKGKPVPDGFVNLAYRVVYRDKQKTLTDQEVNLQHEQVMNALQQKFNLQIRR